MGRESVMASMATSFKSGASCAPIENSPPGIHAMSSGALTGSETVFGMVGRKFASASGFSGTEAATERLVVAEFVDAAFHTVTAPSNTTTPAARPRGTRLDETTGEVLMTLFFLLITCAPRPSFYP